MFPDKPVKFYRYQKFSAMTVESLCHDHLYFSNPTAFNDPLDCQPSVESDSDRGTLRLLLAEIIRRRVETEVLSSLKGAKLKGMKVETHAKKMGDQAARNELDYIAYHATNPDNEGSVEDAESWLLINEIQSELHKQYDRGVCCFSSSVVNPLLWSHYADQHHGFCIGYDLDRDPEPKLHQVQYSDNRKVMTSLIVQAILKNEPKAQELLDTNVLLRKALPWGYEDEWRLLDKRGLQESVLALKDVTFGLRCKTAVMHTIITALESRDDVKFYEMYADRGSFKLKRRLVDMSEMLAYLPHTARSGIEIFGPINDD